jgi:hypothetical protein
LAHHHDLSLTRPGARADAAALFTAIDLANHGSIAIPKSAQILLTTGQPGWPASLLPSSAKSGQAVEHGVEQGAKVGALVEVGENRGGLLLESPITDFVGCTFEERTHTFLGRLHMKL